MEFGRRKPMSLLELCIRKAIDNLRYIESVDGIEMDLLKRILPHCTLEHLTKIEENTKVSQFPYLLLLLLLRKLDIWESILLLLRKLDIWDSKD
jgi:hypothetical protein